MATKTEIVYRSIFDVNNVWFSRPEDLSRYYFHNHLKEVLDYVANNCSKIRVKRTHKKWGIN